MLSFKHAPLVVALSVALPLAAAALGGAVAQAQTPAPAMKTAPVVQIDQRFSQWVGCWRLEDDLTGSGIRVCVIPDNIYNVRIQTLVGAQRGEVESLVPDNVARAITDPTCKGTEKSEWSKDGERVFRWADVTCGTESPRKLSSVLFLAEGPVLVEVQHVDTGAAQNVRVKRYRHAIDQSLPDGSIAPQPSHRTAETALEGSWNVNDVIEASSKIPGDAVQAALTEVDKPFDLSKKSLVAMADAKVSEQVIDLMVALTYPKRLVVQRSGGYGGGYGGGIGLSGLSSMMGPMFDPFYSPIIPAECFSAYNYGYYSNFGGRCGWYYGNTAFGLGYANPFYSNRYYGGYGYYDSSYPWVSVGTANPNAGTAGTPQPESRVINGHGYTQVRTREAEPTAVAGRGYSNGTSTGSSGSTSGGSTGVTSSGYSSGSSSGGSSSGGSSSGGGGERTAVTRPPGGGN